MSGVHIFTLRGIPVFVSVWFLVLAGFISYRSPSFAHALLLGGSIFFSILVHEFGHALVAKYFRLQPQILLHGLGGLCRHERAARDRDDALIVAAGPGAGLLLGLLSLAIYLVVMSAFPQFALERPLFHALFNYLLYINFFWTFLNLLPLWPLDGGLLFRLGLLRVLSPAKAERITHVVGSVVAGGGFIYLLSSEGFSLITLLAGFFLWQNIQRINETRASGPIRLRNTVGHDLIKKAKETMKAGDYAEAARLAHQVKSNSNLDPVMLEKVWEILAVSTAAQEDWDTAWSYVKRAPMTEEVFQAKVRCIVYLGLREEAQTLLASKEANRLPDTARQALEQTLAMG